MESRDDGKFLIGEGKRIIFFFEKSSQILSETRRGIDFFSVEPLRVLWKENDI